MKNGTSQAVLVSEMLSGVGPHLAIADDFVEETCSLCTMATGDDVAFSSNGFLCAACGDLFVQ